MKKCSKCQKNIPSDARVCPYCGSPQGGYKPMKRTKQQRKATLIYYVVALILLFAPMIMTYFMFSSSLTDYDAECTLEKYKPVDDDVVLYQYDSLNDFSKKVKNSDKHVQKIKNLEKEIEGLNLQLSEKSYTFQVTQANNVLTTINYEIVTAAKDSVSVDLSYDYSKDSECAIVYDTQSVIDSDTVCTLVEKLHGSVDENLVLKTIEESANVDTEKMSHYGVGVKNSTKDALCSVRLYKNGHTKLKYKTTLDLQKLI